MRAFIVAAVASVIAGAAHADAITPRAAAGYIGRAVTIHGTVSAVVTDPRSGTTFLDFGPDYPDMDFTAVIFHDHAAAFGNISSVNGRAVDITGVVRLYKGAPEIILNSPSQLSTD
jgi:DNA/RNA endonuclease YhcR with UshA esterase domain